MICFSTISQWAKADIKMIHKVETVQLQLSSYLKLGGRNQFILLYSSAADSTEFIVDSVKFYQ